MLTQGKNMFVETVNVCKIYSHILAHSHLMLQPTIFAILDAHVELRRILWNRFMRSGQIVFFLPNSLIWYLIPAIHLTPKQANTIVPFDVANLSKFGKMKFWDF